MALRGETMIQQRWYGGQCPHCGFENKFLSDRELPDMVQNCGSCRTSTLMKALDVSLPVMPGGMTGCADRCPHCHLLTAIEVLGRVADGSALKGRCRSCGGDVTTSADAVLSDEMRAYLNGPAAAPSLVARGQCDRCGSHLGLDYKPGLAAPTSMDCPNCRLVVFLKPDPTALDTLAAVSPMPPAVLVDAVAEVVKLAQARVNGIGAEHYWKPGEPQTFETMALAELSRYYEEELLDLVNYATMMTIRLRRFREAIDKLNIEDMKHLLFEAGYDTVPLGDDGNELIDRLIRKTVPLKRLMTILEECHYTVTRNDEGEATHA